MGNYNISINGLGQHHNGSEADAERLAARFVKLLRQKGHDVKSATFTVGGDDIADEKNVMPLKGAK